MMREKAMSLFEKFFMRNISLLSMLDKNGNIIKLNSVWRDSFGYDIGSIEGRSYMDFVHPDDMEITNEAIRSISERDEDINFTNRYRHLDGSYHWLDWCAFMNDDIIYLSAHDVTKEREIEERNSFLEEKYLRTFLAAPDAVSIVSASTSKYIEVNDVFCRNTGFEREEIIGKTPTDINLWVYEKERDEILELFRTEGFVRDYMVHFRMRSGEIRSVGFNGEIVDIKNERCFVAFTKDNTDQTKAEENLHLFKTSIDNSNDSVYWINKDAGLEYVNDTACKKLGYTREELLQLSILDVDPEVSKEEWDKVWDSFQSNKEEGSISRYMETVHQRKDGTIFPVEVLMTHFWKDGKEYHLANIRDITERKEQEKRLSRSEEKYRALFENMPNAFYIYRLIYNEAGDPVDFEFAEINPVSERDMRMPAEKAIGRTVKEFFPDTEDYWIKTFDNVVKTGNPVSYINYSVEFDRYYEVFAYYPEEGYCAAIYNDVTDRVKHVEILGKFKASIDYALDGIFWINEEGGFDYVNEQACKMLGYSHEELMALNLLDIDPEGSHEEFKEYWDRLIGRKRFEAFTEERKHRRKDGSIFPVELSSVFIWKDDKGILISYAKDITERKQAELEKLSSLAFFENMDKVNLAIQGSDDLEQMMQDVLQDVLNIYDCDRVYLLYPLDPESAFYTIPMECCKPEYPGAFNDGDPLPVTPLMAEIQEALLNKEETIEYIPDGENSPGEELWDQFGIKSLLSIALYPKVGKPWLFGLHQCSHARKWTDLEKQQYVEIGRRLSDGLSTLLINRDLKQSEERARLFVENTPMPVAMFDTHMCYIVASRQWFITYKIEDQDIIGRNHYEIFPETTEEWKNLNQRAINGEVIKSDKDKFVRQDGSVQWTRYELHPWYKGDGTAGGMIAFTEEITDKVEAAKALEESEQIRQRIFEFAPITIGFLKNRVILDVNSRLCKLTGFSREELIGKATQIVFPSRDEFQEVGKFMYEMLEKHGFSEYESKWKRKDGRIINVYLALTYLNPEDPSKGELFTALDITQQKKIEEDLRIKQIHLLNTVAIAKIGYWEYDNIKDVFTFNDSFYEVYRTSAGKVGGYTMSRARYAELMLHPDDSQVVAEQTKIAVETDDPDYVGYVEHRIVFPDGEIGHVAVRFSVVKNEKGETIGTLGVNQDITDRVHSEQRLLLSRKMLRNIIDNIPTRVFWKDTNSVYLGCNIHFANDTDFHSVKDVEGRTDFELFPDKKEAQVYRENDKQVMISGKEKLNFEETQTRDGKVYWVRTSKIPLYNSDNEVIGVLGTYEDITEKKEAEENLRKAKERAEESEFFLKESQRSGKIGSFKMNFKTNKWTFAEIIDSIYGVKDVSVLDKLDILNVVHPDDQEMIQDYFQQEIIGKHNPFDKEFRIKRIDDGKVRWLHCIGKLYFDTEGNLSQMMGTIQDITDRKLIEEERRMMNIELEKRVDERTAMLHQANKDLESFAYSVSHDLRAPIRHINGFMHLLEKAVDPSDKKVQNYFDKIALASQNMSTMIDELLKFSRLGRANLENKQVKLSVIIKEIVNRLKPDYERRDIQWNIEDLPEVSGDPALLTIAFENLISNAIKYTANEEKALIEIGQKECPESDKVCIYIRDNGAGFDMAYKEKIFGVFQRLHKREEFEGTGIGLANVKKIIIKHKGRIDVESEVNKGATFYITLHKR